MNQQNKKKKKNALWIRFFFLNTQTHWSQCGLKLVLHRTLYCSFFPFLLPAHYRSSLPFHSLHSTFPLLHIFLMRLNFFSAFFSLLFVCVKLSSLGTAILQLGYYILFKCFVIIQLFKMSSYKFFFCPTFLVEHGLNISSFLFCRSFNVYYTCFVVVFVWCVCVCNVLKIEKFPRSKDVFTIPKETYVWPGHRLRQWHRQTYTVKIRSRHTTHAHTKEI